MTKKNVKQAKKVFKFEKKFKTLKKKCILLLLFACKIIKYIQCV